MRYFFHLRDGIDQLLDPEGRSLPDDEGIAAVALREVREIISHDAADGYMRLDQRIDVEDAEGRIVHTQQFSDAIRFIR